MVPRAPGLTVRDFVFEVDGEIGWAGERGGVGRGDGRFM